MRGIDPAVGRYLIVTDGSSRKHDVDIDLQRQGTSLDYFKKLAYIDYILNPASSVASSKRRVVLISCWKILDESRMALHLNS
jgi:hypothetical protein